MVVLEQNALAQHLFEKGHEKGHEEGIQRGRAERSRELALKMLDQGYELSAIQTLTELPLEELEALRQSTIGEPKQDRSASQPTTILSRTINLYKPPILLKT